MKHQALIFCFLLALWDATDAMCRPATIPQGAWARAQRELVHWRGLVTRNPQLHGIDTSEVDVSKATVRSPYIKYVLLDGDNRDFVRSDSPDPRAFATSVQYVFPIYVENEFLGALTIRKNELPDGSKIKGEDDAYTSWGGTMRDDKVTREVLALREQYPNQEIEYVVDEERRGGPFFVITNAAGEVRVVRATMAQKATPHVELRATQSSYVVGEPVKLVVTLRNESEGELRIPELDMLDHNMEFFRYEIDTPQGTTERRRFWSSSTTWGFVEGYTGERLAPGDFVRFPLYPSATYEVGSRMLERTFRSPGTYEVRVVYTPPDWSPVFGGPVRSNSVKLVFRAPTPSEEEVLAPLWISGGRYLSKGDNMRGAFAHVAPLRTVLERHPDSPYSKYIRLSLARSLLSQATEATHYEVIPLLRELSTMEPEFRRAEVAQWLSWSLRSVGEQELAVDVCRKALIAEPELRRDYVFVSHFIAAEIPDRRELQEAVAKWTQERQAGVDRYSKYAPWTIGAVSDLVSTLDYDAARHAAREELASLAAESPGIVFRTLDDWSKLSSARLGEPFLYYWAGDEFVEYRSAPADAILDYMRGFTLRFPVLVDGEALGTLNMSINPETGNYVRLSISNGPEMYGMVLDVRERYSGADGWTVAVLNTGIAGQYFYLTHESGSIRVSPVNKFAAHALGMDSNDVGTGISIPLSEASASIKALAEQQHEQQQR